MIVFVRADGVIQNAYDLNGHDSLSLKFWYRRIRGEHRYLIGAYGGHAKVETTFERADGRTFTLSYEAVS